MSLRHTGFTALLILCLGGCASAPFRPVSYVPLGTVQPGEVLAQFARSLPPSFQLVNTVVFRYGWQTVTVLGYTSVDEDKKTFTVVGLSPVGIKLFEVSGDNDTVLHKFAIEEFTRRGKFTDAVAEDIRRIYFDRVPDSTAKVRKEKDRILFTEPTESGKVEYIFGGVDRALVEKRFYKDDQLLCTVSYYEYRRKEGKLYPAGILLKHHLYGYQLTVRLKEIRS